MLSPRSQADQTVIQQHHQVHQQYHQVPQQFFIQSQHSSQDAQHIPQVQGQAQMTLPHIPTPGFQPVQYPLSGQPLQQAHGEIQAQQPYNNYTTQNVAQHSNGPYSVPISGAVFFDGNNQRQLPANCYYPPPAIPAHVAQQQSLGLGNSEPQNTSTIGQQQQQQQQSQSQSHAPQLQPLQPLQAQRSPQLLAQAQSSQQTLQPSLQHPFDNSAFHSHPDSLSFAASTSLANSFSGPSGVQLHAGHEDQPFPGSLEIRSAPSTGNINHLRSKTYPTETLPKPKALGNHSSSSSLLGMTPATALRNRCNICQKQFKRPSSLQTHLYSHTGEKPFACDWKGCGRLFSVRSNMIRHRKLHERDADLKKQIEKKDVSFNGSVAGHPTLLQNSTSLSTSNPSVSYINGW
ncbi:unnamed protein product [Cyberlindnera jadinii]|uniref:C2H2-type domain-containing protein n=2 Tax=Cyberlindnera jadinii (strain ATCC 18201 / CBS 1600 / BCRC 20928 / JCM 3617 / NBRC 0987 / NRRL Y-1542) TaxID=983966 RepID=A0A0H5C570_CYBJN|nr:unnamed protein product [Cyberlindnera jadinii]